MVKIGGQRCQSHSGQPR